MMNSLLVLALLAQAPDTLWTRIYGGEHHDEGLSVRQTFDGGFIAAGYEEDFGAGLRNIWLVRTDADGDTGWARSYGSNQWEFANCVEQTRDSGFIMTGATADLTTVADLFLIKTDPHGDILWTRTFGDTAYDDGACVRQTTDGGYIVVGKTRSFDVHGSADIWVIRTDSIGDTLWTRAFGGSLWDEGHSVGQTFDGGFVVAGYFGRSSSPNGPDSAIYLLKLDAAGDTMWTRKFDARPDSGFRDYGYSVQQTSDSGYVIVGETWYPGEPAWEVDVYLIRTDANGDTLWTRTYDMAERADVGRSVRQMSDGGFIIAGYTSLGPGGYDALLLRTAADGDTLWTKVIGRPERDEAWSVDVTVDGGFIVAGRTDTYGAGDRDLWLVRVAPDATGLAGGGRLPDAARPVLPSVVIGQFSLPAGRDWRVYDVNGREKNPGSLGPGVYVIRSGDRTLSKLILTR